MNLALYYPGTGYYRRDSRDPFGRRGDFFTAEQLQPVFGRLIRRAISDLAMDSGFRVVELGAGRGELRDFLQPFGYLPVEAGDPLPAEFNGVVLANEFFDALPVDLIEMRGETLRYVDVGWTEDRFTFLPGGEVSGEIANYAARYAPEMREGDRMEICLDALDWVDRIASSLRSGTVLVLDYGLTRRERVRFPAGTLMSYRLHRASPDVLADPGEQDITAHVDFDALRDRFELRGFRAAPLESMAKFLLRLGERDAFEEILRAGDEGEARGLRNQLKTLLAGMGETFRVLRASR
ncbi:MAG: SAM-dependent methyltransferase [Bryobacteraceae bacterium]|nr:SAM-dependent methyltransferase [Bryobacteraceae bacterium]